MSETSVETSSVRFSAEIDLLTGALAAAQLNYNPIVKNKSNPHTKSHYADLQTIVAATQPALAAEGLVIIQVPITRGRLAGSFSRLSHKSGQFVEAELLLPTSMPGKEDKFDAQSIGSAITYSKRYSWNGLSGAVAEDDDDGNAATDNRSQTEQVAKPKTVKAPPVSQKVSNQGGDRPNDSKPVQNKPVATPTPQQRAPQTNDPAPTVPEQESVVPVSEPTAAADFAKDVESTTSAQPTLKSSEKPTKAQFDAYTARAVALKVPLEKAGLKPSKGLQTGAKLKKYLLEVTGVKELTDLAIYQWEDFFVQVEELVQTNPTQVVNAIEGGKTE